MSTDIFVVAGEKGVDAANERPVPQYARRSPSAQQNHGCNQAEKNKSGLLLPTFGRLGVYMCHQRASTKFLKLVTAIDTNTAFSEWSCAHETGMTTCELASFMSSERKDPQLRKSLQWTGQATNRAFS